ncbi:MAG: F0F1 ATP synthase subunit B [Pirellulaceae bacterium]|nr:F0F1 ATP synthase subunit B [Pirellulaceae bacterium]
MTERCCTTGWFGGWLLALALAMLVAVNASRAADDQPAADQPADANQPAAEEPAADKDSASAPGDAAHGDAAHGDAAHGDAAHADAAHGDAAHADAAHGGGHGADMDLSHANPGPNLEAVVEWKSDLAIYSLVVFFLLLLILGKFAWAPIMAGLDRREKAIENWIAEAKENAAKSAEHLQAYDAKLAAATEETREILAQAHRDAEAARQRIVTEAETVAQRQRERAVADIQAAKNVALNEVAQKGAEIAVDLASQIVRRELRPEDHTQLIKESLDRFPSQN